MSDNQNPYESPKTTTPKRLGKARLIVWAVAVLVGLNASLFAFGKAVHYVYCNCLSETQRELVNPALKFVSGR